MYTRIEKPGSGLPSPNESMRKLEDWQVVGNVFLNSIILWSVLAGLTVAIVPYALVWLWLFIPMGFSMCYIRNRLGGVVLDHIAMAVRLDHPLPDYLLIASWSETRPIARRLRRLAFLLAEGHALSTSLASAVPEIPPDVVGEIALAERHGRLSERLDCLSRQDVPWAIRHDLSWPAIIGFLVLIFTALAILSGVAYFIWPKYEKILNSFNSTWLVGFPGLYERALFNIHWPIPTLSWISWCVFIAFLFGYFLRMTFYARHRGGKIQYWLLSRLMWHAPIIGWFTQCRAWAVTTSILAQAGRERMGLPEALEAAAKAQSNGFAKRLIGRCGMAIENGASLGQAFRQAGFPRGLCALFPVAAQNIAGGRVPTELPDSLVSIFHYAHEWYACRYRRALEWTQSALIPMGVLLGGCVVLAVMLTVWLPYLAVIRAVSGMGNF